MKRKLLPRSSTNISCTLATETQKNLLSVDEYLNSNHSSICATLREHSAVQPFQFRNVTAAEIETLADLINKIIASAWVPVNCKLAEICPIFKTKYRPVSILLLFDKIFKKCLNHQLTEHFSVIFSPFLSA